MRAGWLGLIGGACCLLTLSWAGGEVLPLIKTTRGVVYKNCTVTKVEPDALTIAYADGATKIPFEELPTDIQQKFHYDKQAADRYAAEKLARQEERLNRLIQSNPDATLSSLNAPPPPPKNLPILQPQTKPENRLSKADLNKLVNILGIDPKADANPARAYRDGSYVSTSETRMNVFMQTIPGHLSAAAKYAEELKTKEMSLSESHFLDTIIKANQLSSSNSPDEFRRLVTEIRDYIRMMDM